MKISFKNRDALENIKEELKENIFCLNIIKYEIMDTRKDERNNERYEILISLFDRFTNYIQSNSDDLETLQQCIEKKVNMKKWAIRK